MGRAEAEDPPNEDSHWAPPLAFEVFSGELTILLSIK